MLNLNHCGKEINIPTSLKEITLDYMQTVTSDVVIENHYALVAYAIVGKLGVICDTNNKTGKLGATFILVRANDPSGTFKSAPGDKIICGETDIMRGFEVVSPNNVLNTSSIIKKVLAFGKDENGRNIKNPILDMTNGHYNDIIYTVNFKLVPLNDIHGSYKTLSSEETAKIIDATKVYCK